MGFLRFLKKEKKEHLPSFDELDLPPVPPPSQNPNEFAKHYTEVSFPKEDDEQSMPKSPEDMKPETQPLRDEFEIPEMPDTMPLPDTTKESVTHHMPDLIPAAKPEPPHTDDSSILPDMHANIPSFDLPDHTADNAKQDMHLAPSHEIPTVSPEKPHSERRIKKMYFRVDKFSNVLYSLNTLRADLRKTEQVLSEVTSTIENRERDYNKWKLTLLDIKKKLIFVDKTLFKGDNA